MSPPADSGPPPEGGSNAMLYGLSAGVIASFTMFGYAQEAVTRTPFGPDNLLFKFSTFLVLVQSIGNAIVAAAVLYARYGFKTKLNGGVPLKEWIIVALGYFGAHKFGLAALLYIPFPMQVICKSCKAIPVMLGERFIAGKRHPLSKQMGVMCMCVGVVMFTLFGPAKKSAATTMDSKTMFGLLLVLGALVCDGVYGPYQNKISKQYSPSEYHLMLNMNLYQGLLSGIICTANGETTRALAFVNEFGWPIVKLLLLFSAAMAVGNIFIYKLQHEFGALTVTTTTTLRKLISVGFSVIAFGHELTPYQWVAALIVVFNSQLGKMLAKPFADKAKKN